MNLFTQFNKACEKKGLKAPAVYRIKSHFRDKVWQIWSWSDASPAQLEEAIDYVNNLPNAQ